MAQNKLSKFQYLLQSPAALGVGIFILALIPRLLNLDVFVGPDEFSWVIRSANFAQALMNGDFAQTYQTGHPGVTLLWIETIGGAIRYLLSGGADWETILGLDKTMAMLNGERQVVAVANAALVAFTVLLLRRAFGSGVAWVAGFLLAFDPFLLTESRALRTEGLYTGFNMAALASLLLYLKKPRLKYNILSALLTGLALLSKISAASLLPVGALVMAGVPLFTDRTALRERRRQALRSLFIWGVAIVGIIVLLWPALWVGAVEVGQQMFDYVALRSVEGGGGGHSFFMGQPGHSKDFGVSFYLMVLLYRVSPLTWLGVALLILSAGFGRWPSPWQKAAPGVMLFWLLTYMALITRSDLKYDRYIIPALPVLNILSAMGMVAVWRWIAELRPRMAQLGWLAAVLALFFQTALALPHHPYYYTFWNPLLGGIKQAAKVLPVAVGGEGIDRVAAYLNALPDAEDISLASGNSQKIRPLFKGKTIPMTNLDGAWFLADYTFIYLSQLQRGRHDPEIVQYLQRRPPVFKFDFFGLDYGWLYQGPGAQYFGGDTKLEGRGVLHAYTLSATTLSAGNVLSVTVYFRNEGQQPTDRFYARIVDAGGYIWAEAPVNPRPGFEGAFHTRKAVVEGEARLTLPIGMLPGRYVLKMGFDDLATGQPIGEFALPDNSDDIVVSRPDAFSASRRPNPPDSMDLQLRNELALLGYGLSAEQVRVGESLWLTLYWQALTDVEHDYVLGIQLLDQSDTEITYWLGRPARSSLPTNEWQLYQAVQDPWLLKIPADFPPGTYKLALSVYDAATTEPVAADLLQEIQVTTGETGIK